MPTPPGRRLVIDVSWTTLLRLLAAALAVWCLLQLVQTILVLVVAILLAVTLEPAVRWLEARRLARWLAATTVSLFLLFATAGFLWMTWNSLVEQSEFVQKRFADISREALERLPASWREAAASNTGETLSAAGGYLISLGQSTLSALTVIVLAFVLAFYLLIDGRRVYEWFLAFVPLRYRARAERTFQEGREVLFGYMIGNVLTSIIAATSTFVALWILGVPAALVLALAAGLSDFVPVVGFVVSSVPAVVLAFAVSGKTALLVVLFYIGYNTVESYVLSPWAYGGRLRLSDFAVVLAFVVGAELAGVIGAVIALPLAAIYPTVERLWLRGQLPDETLQDHKGLQAPDAG